MHIRALCSEHANRKPHVAAPSVCLADAVPARRLDGAKTAWMLVATTLPGAALFYGGVRGDFLVLLAGVAATVAYSGATSFVVLVAVDGLAGLRVSGATETEGLDIVEHGEAVV